MGKQWSGQFSNFRAKSLSLLTFCLLAGSAGLLSSLSFALPSQAQSPATPMPKQIGLLENRFFYHLYVQDPIEKRLERLELLVFGGTQAGTNDERLARLKKAIAERDTASAQPAKPPAEDTQEKAQTAEPDKSKQSSTQYPILTTLEWRLLKKTYPNDSMDARLERMETKVFGQASPAMAYADRVERLKKTVGVGIADEAPKGKMGPRPKARPRLEDGSPIPDGFGMMPTIPNLPTMPTDPLNGQRGMNPFFGDFNSMFRELDRQMQEMMRMPPGHYEYDPNTGQWTERDTGRKLSPDTAPPPAPPKKKQKPPPYYDPNTI